MKVVFYVLFNLLLTLVQYLSYSADFMSLLSHDLIHFTCNLFGVQALIGTTSAHVRPPTSQRSAVLPIPPTSTWTMTV